MTARRLLPWTIALSFALHGVAYASLSRSPVPGAAKPHKTQLRFEVAPKAKPVPEPTPPPPEPPKPTKRAEAKPELPPLEAPPPPLPEPAAPSGVTLAGDGSGSGFGMALAQGGALEPLRPPAPPPVNAPPPVQPLTPARTEPPVVAVGDLSARPSPSALGSALERNYPADARRRGQSGTAKVRARIDPDGVVRRVSLVEESAAGFGTACTRTLNGSRWAAPRDKAGRPVATEIRYTCRFVVEP